MLLPSFTQGPGIKMTIANQIQNNWNGDGTYQAQSVEFAYTYQAQVALQGITVVGLLSPGGQVKNGRHYEAVDVALFFLLHRLVARRFCKGQLIAIPTSLCSLLFAGKFGWGRFSKIWSLIPGIGADSKTERTLLLLCGYSHPSLVCWVWVYRSLEVRLRSVGKLFCRQGASLECSRCCS